MNRNPDCGYVLLISVKGYDNLKRIVRDAAVHPIAGENREAEDPYQGMRDALAVARHPELGFWP